MITLKKSALCLMVPFFITAASCQPVYAHDFPAEQVEYVCRVAPYYVTTPSDACIMEQYEWFAEASQSDYYEKQLWYGQRLNYKGKVVGIDFKPVVDRVRWLAR